MATKRSRGSLQNVLPLRAQNVLRQDNPALSRQSSSMGTTSASPRELFSRTMGAPSGFLAAVISTVSYQILFILMTAIFANMAYRYGLCALWLFSIEHAVNMTSGSCAEVGMEVLQALTLVAPGALASLFAVFSAVALVVISLLFAKFSLDSLWGLSLEEEGSFNENERLRYACERIVKAYGLTQREGEVLLMCVKGKKPAAIASELFIEVSTARTHIKHLYTKLDVHSSKELIGFVTEEANRVGLGNAAD